MSYRNQRALTALINALQEVEEDGDEDMDRAVEAVETFLGIVAPERLA